MSFTQHCKPNTTYLATYLFSTIYKDYRKKTMIFYRPGENNNNKYLTSIDNLNQFWNDNVGEWEALQHSVLGRVSSLCLSPQSSENHIEDCEIQ